MKQSEIKLERNPNHPRKGKRIKPHPIGAKKHVEAIKKNLKGNPRNLALFVLGIRLGLRANELLSLTFEQVGHLKVGDSFEVIVSKQDDIRILTLDTECVEVIQNLKAHSKSKVGPLAMGKRGVLGVDTFSRMVKEWCMNIPALRKSGKNFASHSLRQQFICDKVEAGVPVGHLTKVMRHSSEQQTLDYARLQAQVEKDIYLIDDKEYQNKKGRKE